MNADQLVSQGRATLGETIEHMPGVRGSSFGAGASRPVIRGMDGARVKVLSDGIDVLDASTLSADHAVTTEPLLLQQIEVLKGPATLLYGGGAVGVGDPRTIYGTGAATYNEPGRSFYASATYAF